MEKDAKYERELKQQRRIMTMLLNKERMRKRESNKSSDTSKIEKTIDKASKELTKLTEEEIRLNEKLLDAINKAETAYISKSVLCKVLQLLFDEKQRSNIVAA